MDDLKDLYRAWQDADAKFADVLEGMYGKKLAGTVRYQPHKWTAPVRAAWSRVEEAQKAFEGAGGREWLRRACVPS